MAYQPFLVANQGHIKTKMMRRDLIAGGDNPNTFGKVVIKMTPLMFLGLVILGLIVLANLPMIFAWIFTIGLPLALVIGGFVGAISGSWLALIPLVIGVIWLLGASGALDRSSSSDPWN